MRRWFSRLIGRWRLRKARREMADAIAQIRAEEKARLLAKRERALQAIAENSGVRRIRQW